MSVERCGHGECGYDQLAEYCLSDAERFSELVHAGLAAANDVLRRDDLFASVEVFQPIDGGNYQMKFFETTQIDDGQKIPASVKIRIERNEFPDVGIEQLSLVWSWRVGNSNEHARHYRISADSEGYVSADTGCPAEEDDYLPMTPYDFEQFQAVLKNLTSQPA